MPKRYFLKVYKDCVSLCSIIRVKSFPSGWSGQKEDICPSIKKSIYYVQEGTVVRVDPGFVHPLTSCWDHSLLAYNKTQLNGHWLREKIFYQNTFYIWLLVGGFLLSWPLLCFCLKCTCPKVLVLTLELDKTLRMNYGWRNTDLNVSLHQALKRYGFTFQCLFYYLSILECI